MNKKNKIYIVLIIVCTVLVMIICGIMVYLKSKNNNSISDALKFKKEYEAYNLVVSNEVTYRKLDIDENNPIIYKTPKQILDVLKEDTAVIYFGFPNSNFARENVEIFLEAAKEKNIKTIYYVNIAGIRDEYEANGTLYPTKIKEEVPAYTDLLKFFGDNLEDYYVVDSSNGFEYAAGVKRLCAPTVVITDHGEIKDIYASNYDLELNFTDGLTDEQRTLFKNKYLEMFSYISDKENVTCSINGC